MVKTENFEKVEITAADQFRNWLLQHHAQEESIWRVTFKKHHPEKYVSREEVLDELLCFGWIDGVRRKLDTDRTMQLVAPRRAQHWAKTYKDRAARLEKEGRMHEAGLKSIQKSKRKELWNFLDDVDALIIPEDLFRELKAHPPALECFDAFPDSSKRFILRWIKLAQKTEPRIKRIRKTAILAKKNEWIPGS